MFVVLQTCEAELQGGKRRELDGRMPKVFRLLLLV